ncbi:MAG: diheme cytochrome c [Arcobacter sp.]|uniref:diheme cytochrome c n=1 Tax=Arcobacter sp. TaxID=1872629 RepID=UPI003B004B0C
MKTVIFLTIISSCIFADSYFFGGKAGVKPVDTQLYKTECGACHFAYQAGLLPSNSWNKMMNNLENHFNTDATLAKEDFEAIKDYLNKNSAEKAMQYKRSNRIVSSIRNNDIPESISKTPYMIRKHDELRPSMIKQDDVKGLFNCVACHTTANKGIYSERDIRIPNFGRWED